MTLSWKQRVARPQVSCQLHEVIPAPQHMGLAQPGSRKQGCVCGCVAPAAPAPSGRGRKEPGSQAANAPTSPSSQCLLLAGPCAPPTGSHKQRGLLSCSLESGLAPCSRENEGADAQCQPPMLTLAHPTSPSSLSFSLLSTQEKKEFWHLVMQNSSANLLLLLWPLPTSCPQDVTFLPRHLIKVFP